MFKASGSEKSEYNLVRYLSPVGAWSLAFGCSVGWGAFIMPGTTFLPIAGPMGTVVGMLVGGFIMFLIGVNYHFMMNRYGDCGGTFSYAKNEMGYDHGFLSSWFLILVYMAIIWANSTAILLFCRDLFGGFFEKGLHYSVAGFEVYLPEILIAVFSIVIVGCICLCGGRVISFVQSLFAFILIGGIIISACVIVFKNHINIFAIKPPFCDDEGSEMLQVLRIVALSPWAFVGFESISHSTEEFDFSPKKSIVIFISAVIAGVAAYSLLSLIAVSALPEGCNYRPDYINGSVKRLGFEAIPVFNAVHTYMGDTGIVMLGLTTAAGIITGLLGNMVAASRLLFAMAKDNMIPEGFLVLNKNSAPLRIVMAITGVSVIIPFFGRIATGWIVDVNTVCATIAYAYTSICAFRIARRENNFAVKVTGTVGIVVSVFFTLYFLIPNFWSVEAMAYESYMILLFWCILGFVFFRYILKRDKERKFGKSSVGWIVLLFLVFFLSMQWFREASRSKSHEVLAEFSKYHDEELYERGIRLSKMEKMDSVDYFERNIDKINRSMQINSTIQMLVIMFALFVMFSIYVSMNRREHEMEIQKIKADESNKAKSAFLSNMSHDIRTPMNAIIGYIGIAKKVENVPEEELSYLDKIEASSKHLLALINDVLDMSRIESGKMELDIKKADIVKTVSEVYDLFATQMKLKDIDYRVETSDVTDRVVMCDANRLNRVLLNLISNAYKFTPEGGSVTVTLVQNGTDDDIGHYNIRVKDTGMGMSKEFAAKVFDAYEREKTVSNIQGTGLGMSITKSIVDLMGGIITVETEQGKGTEFIINVDFAVLDEVFEEEAKSKESDESKINYQEMTLLLAEDQFVNREIATMILTTIGFKLDYAENGQDAVDKVRASKPGDYNAVLMDIQMPVMNGYEAARAIREIEDDRLSQIPIIAMTGNAFLEDIKAAMDAGMNGHVSKPIEVDKLIEELNKVLSGV